MTHLAYIALGSNMGDRQNYIDSAIDGLRRTHGVEVLDVSPPVETRPVGGPAGQQNYLNAAAAVRTNLTARELLDRLQRIETDLGRQRPVRWGPRTIDLDLLLYDDEIIDDPGLTVPHPRMHQRQFVMEPLARIAPDVVHPTLKRTARQILEELTQNAHVDSGDD